MTKALAASAADDAQVVPLEKYGTPPEVPAIVNAGVVVGLAIETIPPVHPTLVTVPEPPPPAGVAQVPSPLQNVVLEADVPLLRLVTGKFPVTPVDNGKPVALVKVPLDGVPNGPPLINKVPVASGSVNVRLAVSVVGVSVTP
jgi:hypothetical protein